MPLLIEFGVLIGVSCWGAARGYWRVSKGENFWFFRLGSVLKFQVKHGSVRPAEPEEHGSEGEAIDNYPGAIDSALSQVFRDLVASGRMA